MTNMRYSFSIKYTSQAYIFLIVYMDTRYRNGRGNYIQINHLSSKRGGIPTRDLRLRQKQKIESTKALMGGCEVVNMTQDIGASVPGSLTNMMG